MAESSPPGHRQDPIDLAIVISDRVQIRNVSLVGTHASRADASRFPQEGLAFKHTVTPGGVVRRESESQIDVRLSFTLTSIKDDQVELDPILLIEATFVLTYILDSWNGVDERNLTAFAATNGVYNAWPYWREYLQSTTVRMGIPPITAPVFRFSASPPSPEPKGDD